MRTAKQLASGGVAALEHGLEPGHRYFALQPQAGGASAVPPAWGLAVTGQVRLVVGGQLTGVVGLPATESLAMSATTPPLPSSPSLAPASTPGALLSSKNGLG
jgi:hypothetical protein